MPRNLMFSTISVKRPTYGQDTAFGQTAPLITVYDEIPASIQPANGSVIMMYAQRQLQVTHSIFLDTAITVKNGDVITDGTNNYTVIGFEDLIRLQRVFKIDCFLILTA